MSNTACPPTRRAELFVRADLPEVSERRLTALEERLRELQRIGVFDEVETTVWEKRVPVEGSCEGPERSLYNEFSAWGREAGASLSPFFGTRECYSYETGERRTELVLPALCLAVYEGGRLAQVAPFARGGSPQSVEDCLDDFETGRDPSTTRSVSASTAD